MWRNLHLRRGCASRTTAYHKTHQGKWARRISLGGLKNVQCRMFPCWTGSSAEEALEQKRSRRWHLWKHPWLNRRYTKEGQVKLAKNKQNQTFPIQRTHSSWSNKKSPVLQRLLQAFIVFGYLIGICIVDSDYGVCWTWLDVREARWSFSWTEWASCDLHIQWHYRLEARGWRRKKNEFIWLFCSIGVSFSFI